MKTLRILIASIFVIASAAKAELVLEGAQPAQVPPAQAPTVQAPAAQAVVAPTAPTATTSAPSGAAAQVTVPANSSGNPIIFQQVQNSESQAGATQTSTQDLSSENQSRVERIRRERLREEVKNEDMLQTRLEELRLRGENERSSQINQFGAPVAAPAPAVVAPAPQTIQIIAPTPVNAPITAVPAVSGSSQATSVLEADKPVSRIGLVPRVGFFKLTDTGGYDVQPRLAVGAGLEVSAGDHLGVDFSYTYAQHTVWINSQNPYFAQFNTGYGYNPGYGPGYGNPYGAPNSGGGVDMSFNQNLFEVGPKLFLTKQNESVRPFVGIGGVYSYSYLNYSKSFVEAYRASPIWNNIDPIGQDYTVSQFMGSISAGMDVRLTDSLSFGAIFKYYRSLASSTNGRLPYAALYYGRYGSMPGFDPSSLDKAYLGGSLADSNAYTVQASLNFHF